MLYKYVIPVEGDICYLDVTYLMSLICYLDAAPALN